VNAKAITPILNVSNIQESFAWFENLGWRKLWDWGDPPSFGAVGSGECEIFLALNSQGGRGKGHHGVHQVELTAQYPERFSLQRSLEDPVA